MPDSSTFPFQIGNAAWPCQVAAAAPPLSWQGLGLQGTAVNHLQHSHTLAVLLQDLKLDTTKSLDGTCPRMQFCTWGNLI